MDKVFHGSHHCVGQEKATMGISVSSVRVYVLDYRMPYRGQNDDTVFNLRARRNDIT
jgi:hypothetical protein